MSRMLNRRSLLGLGVSTIAGSAISCSRDASSVQWQFLKPAEARTLEAICGQIIPADRDPGAKEAGVVNYIDIQLKTKFRRYRKAYRNGLARIDATSHLQFGRPFADLSSTDQVQVLKAAEERDGAFFALLIDHTRQGFYGDPRHGGNRNRVSWKMLRLSYPQVRGRQHYETQRAG